MLRSIAARAHTSVSTSTVALRCVSKQEAAPTRAAPILRDARACVWCANHDLGRALLRMRAERAPAAGRRAASVSWHRRKRQTRSAPSPAFAGEGWGGGRLARIFVHAPTLTLPRKRGGGNTPSLPLATTTPHRTAAANGPIPSPVRAAPLRARGRSP